jgi:hypothetical protein
VAVAIAANGTFPFSESVLREEIEKVRMELQSPGKLVGGVIWVRTVLAEKGEDEFWKREVWGMTLTRRLKAFSWREFDDFSSVR